LWILADKNWRKAKNRKELIMVEKVKLFLMGALATLLFLAIVGAKAKSEIGRYQLSVACAGTRLEYAVIDTKTGEVRTDHYTNGITRSGTWNKSYQK
jgi:hypothetical protein